MRKNSGNSSKPPSSDIVKPPKPDTAKRRKKRAIGGQETGRRHWTWCFRAPRFTVFHIDPSRSSQVLRAVLDETFGGVIGCDYFSAYHKYMADSGATVQFCVAHLIRDIRFLAEQTNKSIARWGEKLLV